MKERLPMPIKQRKPSRKLLLFITQVLGFNSLVDAYRRSPAACFVMPPIRRESDPGSTKSPIRRGRALAVMRSDLMYTDAFSVPLLLGSALVVGIAAQSFINKMLEGDQGLGAFLKDGSGYNKSRFRPASSTNEKQDPLPWLKLPELDFVEVAGQEKTSSIDAILVKLEILREKMDDAFQQGKIQEAESLRKELEDTMQMYGIEFMPDDN